MSAQKNSGALREKRLLILTFIRTRMVARKYLSASQLAP